MREGELLKLDAMCRSSGVKLLIVRSYGLVGYLRVSGLGGAWAKLPGPARVPACMGWPTASAAALRAMGVSGMSLQVCQGLTLVALTYGRAEG